MKSMATKSCEIDVLPTTLPKDNQDHLIGVVMKLVNTTLKQGVYAKSWKMAITQPLLKTKGLELIQSNFRPMSNLSFYFKTSRIVKVQIWWVVGIRSYANSLYSGAVITEGLM